MYRLYGALLALGWAAVLPYQTLMGIRKRTPLPALRERLGSLPKVAVGGFWVHAVSVGEVRLALRLLKELKRLFPGAPVHLTTGTATGRSLAVSGDGGAAPDSVGALPFDLPFAMGRLLDRLRPRAVLVLETEIWPNLLRGCERRGVPVLLINGRISRRSHPRYRVIRPFLRRVLPGFRILGMQSAEDAERIIGLGAPRERVRVTGNLKFDLDPPREDRAALRSRLGVEDTTPLFVAGSTAPGEETPVLEALATLRLTDRRARLILAPRHPGDFAAAARAARAAGLRVASWSGIAEGSAAGGRTGGGENGPWDVLVLDALGVLPRVYAAADLVFVGGSLTRRGGQNVLEPAAQGHPVLFGPHMENFQSISEALVAAGAGFVVRDAVEMGARLAGLLRDRGAYETASARAAGVVQSNRGALRRSLSLIEEALAPAAGADLRAAGT